MNNQPPFEPRSVYMSTSGSQQYSTAAWASDEASLIDFTSCCSDNMVGLFDPACDAVSDVLEQYKFFISLLNEGQSLAGNLGEELRGPFIAKNLNRIFDSDAPPHPGSNSVGPSSLTWLDVVQAAPGYFDRNVHGNYQCKVEGKLSEVTDEEHATLTSGLPKKFLSPWPDTGDLRLELDSVNLLISQVHEVETMVSQGETHKQSNQMKLQKLTNCLSYIVAQLPSSVKN